MKVMIIVKSNPESEAGRMPTDKELAEMTSFNEELVKAGIMLDGAGLTASSKGARVRFDGKQRQVIDGPFSETKELIAGFWVLDVKSLAEALEWAKRIPFQEGEVEVRPYAELTDFVDASPETIARNEKLAKATEERKRA